MQVGRVTVVAIADGRLAVLTRPRLARAERLRLRELLSAGKDDLTALGRALLEFRRAGQPDVMFRVIEGRRSLVLQSVADAEPTRIRPLPGPIEPVALREASQAIDRLRLIEKLAPRPRRQPVPKNWRGRLADGGRLIAARLVLPIAAVLLLVLMIPFLLILPIALLLRRWVVTAAAAAAGLLALSVTGDWLVTVVASVLVTLLFVFVESDQTWRKGFRNGYVVSRGLLAQRSRRRYRWLGAERWVLLRGPYDITLTDGLDSMHFQASSVNSIPLIWSAWMSAFQPPPRASLEAFVQSLGSSVEPDDSPRVDRTNAARRNSSLPMARWGDPPD